MAENGGSLGALDPIALAGSALRLEDFLLDAHPQLHPGQDVWQRGGQHAPVRQVMIASFPPSNCSLRWPSGVCQEGCVNKSVSRGSLTTGSPGADPPQTGSATWLWMRSNAGMVSGGRRPNPHSVARRNLLQTALLL